MKCDDCPLSGQGIACAAEDERFEFFCERATEGGFRRHIVGRSTILAGAAPAITQPIVQVGLSVPKGTLPLDVALRFQREVGSRGCRSKDTECGCNGYRCAEGKGRDGKVNDWDCLSCLGYLDDTGKPVRCESEPSKAPAPHGD